MLILTRKRNESVVIGEGADAIRVMIVKIDGHLVQLGIDAPKSVKILRDNAVKREYPPAAGAGENG